MRDGNCSRSTFLQNNREAGLGLFFLHSGLKLLQTYALRWWKLNQLRYLLHIPLIHMLHFPLRIGQRSHCNAALRLRSII